MYFKIKNDISVSTATYHALCHTQIHGPFVCLFAPLIGNGHTPVSPFVDKNIPIIGFHKNQRLISGYSLVELMATLIIVGILLGFGVPGFRNFISNNRTTAAHNDLLTDIAFARAEALKQRSRVGVCRSDGTSCLNDTAWASGWALALDTSPAGTAWTGSYQILKFHEAIPAELTLTARTNSSPGVDTSLIVFGSDALIVPTAAGDNSFVYRLCNKKILKQKKIVIERTGRTKTTEETCS